MWQRGVFNTAYRYHLSVLSNLVIIILKQKLTIFAIFKEKGGSNRARQHSAETPNHNFTVNSRISYIKQQNVDQS